MGLGSTFSGLNDMPERIWWIMNDLQKIFSSHMPEWKAEIEKTHARLDREKEDLKRFKGLSFTERMELIKKEGI
jgi:hypothetical protein